MELLKQKKITPVVFRLQLTIFNLNYSRLASQSSRLEVIAKKNYTRFYSKPIIWYIELSAFYIFFSRLMVLSDSLVQLSIFVRRFPNVQYCLIPFWMWNVFLSSILINIRSLFVCVYLPHKKVFFNLFWQLNLRNVWEKSNWTQH